MTWLPSRNKAFTYFTYYRTDISKNACGLQVGIPNPLRSHRKSQDICFDRSTHALSFHISHVGFRIIIQSIPLVLQKLCAIYVVRTAKSFSTMAAANTSGAAMRFYIDECNSNSDFYV